MAKILCPAIECKYYSPSGCRSPRVFIGEARFRTATLGFRDVRYCRSFDESEEAQFANEYLKRVLNEDKV